MFFKTHKIVVYFLVLIFVCSGLIVFIPVPAAAAPTNYYLMVEADINNDTMRDIQEYSEQFTFSSQDQGVSSWEETYYLQGGHIYYLFINVYLGGAHTFHVDSVNVADQYIHTLNHVGDHHFRVYALYMNKSVIVNLAASSVASTWHSSTIQAGGVYIDMTLEYEPILKTAQYLSSWYVRDTYFERKPNSTITASVVSQFTTSYTWVKGLADNAISYHNVTTSTEFFIGDIYLIIERLDSVNRPQVYVSVAAGSYIHVGEPKNELQLDNNNWTMFYRIMGIYNYYDDVQDISIRVDNTGAPTGALSILRTLNVADTGIWSKYSRHYGGASNALYGLWCVSSYISDVRVFVWDGIDPLPDMFVVLNNIIDGWDYTNDVGLTRYFRVTRAASQIFTVYDSVGNGYSVYYAPIHRFETLFIEFRVPLEHEEYFVYFNDTTLPDNTLTHTRTRYYYYLDQISTYILNISYESINVFEKELYSNTGYLDYFFTTPGIYWFNITTADNIIMTSENITVVDNKKSKYYFHPAYTPMKCHENHPFYYWNNRSGENLFTSIEGEHYLSMAYGVEGMFNLSFFNEGIYFTEIVVMYDNVSYTFKKEKVAAYTREYIAHVDIINISLFGDKRINYEHNFIGEGGTYLRVSDTPDFSNIIYEWEISSLQKGHKIVELGDINKTYYVDIIVDNHQIAITSMQGNLAGYFIVENAPMSDMLISLGNIIGVSPGLAGGFITGVIIMICVLIPAVMHIHSDMVYFTCGLVGIIFSWGLGLVELWILFLFGIIATAMLAFGMKSGGGAGG